MTRVLHLLTAEPGVPSAALAALVADTIQHEPGEHHVLLRGGESLRDAADAAGLRPYTLLPDSGLPWPGLLPCTLRQGRLLLKCDRVDAWTPRAAQLARKAGAPAVQPRFHPAHLARLAEQYTDPRRLNDCDREAQRAAWRLKSDDWAVAMIGRKAEDADTALAALAGVMVQGILDRRGEAGRLHIVCHPLHPRRREAQRMLDGADFPGLLIQQPSLETPWLAYPACDAALVTDTDAAPTLHYAWARRAGLPIHTPTTTQPSALAQAILEHIDASHVACTP